MVDFSRIPTRHDAINLRLEQWAKWVSVHPQPWKVQPMFRQYRSSDQWATPSASMPVDQRDAAKINKGWQQLPGNHRAAIRWHYISPGSPAKACKGIGCTMADLARFVVDGRAMLINRGV